ncbi:hypothetical protein [Shewanella atlantica]|uniref:hypothetical protein n=1 Tax=Shewanella atlantica TaxID=271099 RepID=UPI003734C40E
MIIGNKQTIAFVIGEFGGPNMREVDIWVGGELVTYIDNLAYLPQFIASLKRELDCIEHGDISDEYIALPLGPTTDDVSAKFSVDEKIFRLNCLLGNGNRITGTLPVIEVVDYYKRCIEVLSQNA